MKIEASMVNMSSNREYLSYVNKKQASLVTNAEDAAAIFELSTLDNGKDAVTNMEDYQKNKETKQKEMQDQNLINHLSNMIKSNKVRAEETLKIRDEKDLQLECLRKIIDSLNKYFNKKYGKKCDSANSRLENYASYAAKAQSSFSLSSMTSISSQGGALVSGAGTWVKTTATSVFMTETEHTTFNSTGVVRTSDGREIEFGVSLEMSRAFCARYDSFTQEEVIFTDPLIINVDGNVGKVEDQKFLFDLNCDGEKEEISFAGQGSGFLALDKNNDGVINDGFELFGTKSGNGFKDLAEYDSDNNGWIDENDDVFDDLKVWSKGPNGEDRLITLKEADVGAIYLGYADTEFTLNNMETNSVNGIVRNTGIFLKESGGVGTVQHVDLAL